MASQGLASGSVNAVAVGFVVYAVCGLEIAVQINAMHVLPGPGGQPIRIGRAAGLLVSSPPGILRGAPQPPTRGPGRLVAGMPHDEHMHPGPDLTDGRPWTDLPIADAAEALRAAGHFALPDLRFGSGS
jgi:hypothetical protein